ncbi:MAG: recombinase family protein [Alphaproteobacteria bacterium]|nr:recombinase family protein [Alphaproteobacteria bacterium]
MVSVGYARVSTLDQTLSSQLDALKTAGCHAIHEEHASGGREDRPILTKVLADLSAGDVLIVTRLDRLARSLTHLMRVLEDLERREVKFRSLADPIDTTTPQGKFTLQVLGAAAELERALIKERTKAGLAAARARGRIGGNPRLKAGDPAARAEISERRRESYMARLIETADLWLPTVRRMRPLQPWEDVVRVLNSNQRYPDHPWTPRKLSRAVNRLVDAGLAHAELVMRAPPAPPDDRTLMIVAGIKSADPDITLKGIADKLQKMREPTPRGRDTWTTSSVDHLLRRARARGYIIL